MGLFDALTSAVSGLQAQSFAMQNISGNIANSQTIAYKGVNTTFQDLIPGGGALTNQPAGGVVANSVATNSVQGAIQTSTIGTDMAINGDGYFIVQKPAGYSRQFADFRRGQQLHTARRLHAQRARLPGQQRRLLPRRHPDRSDHRQSDRQRRRAAAICQQLPAGQSIDRGQLRHQPADDAANRRLQFADRQFGTDQSRRLHGRPHGRGHRNRDRHRRLDLRQ